MGGRVNLEARREYQRRYRETHRAQLNANQRRYAHRHAKELTAARREKKHAYYIANRDAFAARRRKWQTENRERAHDHEHAHRARQFGNGGTHTYIEWLAKRAEYGNVCAYCKAAKPLERDHIVPLSRGGTNDIANIVPACRSCNARKHAKTRDEFLALKGAA